MAVLSRKSYPDENSQHFDPETGNCSIEYYLACKDTYRVAPNDEIPVLWPCNKYKASDAGEKLFHQLEAPIRRVLESYGIATHEISIHTLAFQLPRRKQKDTIIIKTYNESNATWKNAISDIYNEIVQPAATSAQLQIRIEIRNENLMYKDYSHAFQDDAAAEVLERTQPLVIDAVKEYCQGMWSAVSFHERGLEPHDIKNKPSVVVMIRPGSVNAWGAFEEKIVGIVESVLLPGDRIYMLSFCLGLSRNAKVLSGVICNSSMELGWSRGEVKVNELLGGPFRGSQLKNNI